MGKRFRKEITGGKTYFYGLSILPEARVVGGSTGGWNTD